MKVKTLRVRCEEGVDPIHFYHKGTYTELVAFGSYRLMITIEKAAKTSADADFAKIEVYSRSQDCWNKLHKLTPSQMLTKPFKDERGLNIVEFFSATIFRQDRDQLLRIAHLILTEEV